MNYTLSIANGYIIGVCESEGHFPIEITKAERDAVFNKLMSRPTAEEGYQYMLKADTMEWELVELPQPSEDDELDDAEALSIITGESE